MSKSRIEQGQERGIVPEGVWLVASLTGGRAALFYSLVLLHAVAALVGFASIGFAGTYAARAFLPGDEASPGAGGQEPSGPGPRDQGTSIQGTGIQTAALSAGSGPAGTGPAGTGPAGTGAGPTSTGVADQDAEVEELMRYFERPARFWLALVAVPFLGLGALAANPDIGGLDQAWVLGALLVWLAATLIAVSLVVPSLRQMRTMLLRSGKPDAGLAGGGLAGGGQTDGGQTDGGQADAGQADGGLADGGLAGGGLADGGLAKREAEQIRFTRAATLAGRGAACCDVLFFVALALMIWRP
jgi:hypothetical protein